jgi:hypothetical protein
VSFVIAILTRCICCHDDILLRARSTISWTDLLKITHALGGTTDRPLDREGANLRNVVIFTASLREGTVTSLFGDTVGRVTAGIKLQAARNVVTTITSLSAFNQTIATNWVSVSLGRDVMQAFAVVPDLGFHHSLVVLVDGAGGEVRRGVSNNGIHDKSRGRTLVELLTVTVFGSVMIHTPVMAHLMSNNGSVTGLVSGNLVDTTRLTGDAAHSTQTGIAQHISL